MEQNENEKETDDKGVELVTERPTLSGLKQYSVKPSMYDKYGTDTPTLKQYKRAEHNALCEQRRRNAKQSEETATEKKYERPKLSGLKQSNINPHNYDIYGGEPKSHSESMYENYYAHLWR